MKQVVVHLAALSTSQRFCGIVEKLLSPCLASFLEAVPPQALPKSLNFGLIHLQYRSLPAFKKCSARRKDAPTSSPTAHSHSLFVSPPLVNLRASLLWKGHSVAQKHKVGASCRPFTLKFLQEQLCALGIAVLQIIWRGNQML